MAGTWYYAENGARQGPMSFDELCAKIRDDAQKEHLVWTQGMETWREAREVQAFDDLFRTLPPPLPTRLDPARRPTAPVPYAPPQAVQPYAPAGQPYAAATPQPYAPTPVRVSPLLHPWRRYFARSLDNTLFILIAAFMLGVMFPGLFAGDSNVASNVLSVVLLALYIPAEGFLLYSFGTTPGKALYGIRIVRDGAPIAWGDATKRAFAVWLRGMGVGIPIVTLFTLINAYNKLKANGRATWDAEYGWTVTHTELSGLRWFGIIAAWVVLIVVVAALVAIGERAG